MYATTLSSKYQFVVPKALRETLGLQAGQVFLMVPKGGTLQLVPERSLEDIIGLLPNANTNDYRDRSDLA